MVKLGTAATFKCISDSPVKWRFNKRILVSPAGHELVISNVKLSDSGLYSCLGSFGIHEKDFVARGNLKVIGEFIISKN